MPDGIIREEAGGDGGASSGTETVDERWARDLVPIVLGVVAPAAVLTALLYYFGWAVTSAQARVLSLDESAFGYTTRDYLLRSTGAVFVPLGGLLLLGMTWIWAHTVLSGWIDLPARRRTVSRLASILLVSGSVMVSIGLIGAIWPRLGTIVPPLALGLGISLCAYAVFIRGRLHHAQGRLATSLGPVLRTLNAMMVFLLVGLCVFWLIGVFAVKVGEERARRAMGRLAARPNVTLYSADRLNISAPDVEETELHGRPDSAERYRYQGLKLLFWANGKYFLVSEGWGRTNGTTIVLHDTPALRLEFSPSPNS